MLISDPYKRASYPRDLTPLPVAAVRAPRAPACMNGLLGREGYTTVCPLQPSLSADLAGAGGHNAETFLRHLWRKVVGQAVFRHGVR